VVRLYGSELWYASLTDTVLLVTESLNASLTDVLLATKIA
jgi:hypothetical protein